MNTENLSDSGVDHLLATCPPWLGADTVAGRLLNFWRMTIAPSPCALIWFDHAARETVCVIASVSDIAARGKEIQADQQIIRVNGQIDISQLGLSSSEALRRLKDLVWKSLAVEEPASQTPAPHLGLPSQVDWTKIRPDWFRATSLALDWSRKFDEQLRGQKLASLSEFAAGAGHEINNPLGSIIGRTSQLLKGETDPEKRRLLETIGAQAYRIGDMIGDTMLFAQPPGISPELLRWDEVIPEVISKFQPEVSAAGIQLELALSPGVRVFADPVQLRILASEPIRNSLRALSDLGTAIPRKLRLSCASESRGDVPGGRLEVSDNGPGLDADQQRHCFDPFYSGRQAGRGLGFGLSKCWRIVQQHSGEISLNCHAGETRLEVWIPETNPAVVD